MIDREDIGSWLDGPQFSVPEGYWPGKNLGLPETGPGSTAPLWRRILGIILDWAMSYLIAEFLFGGNELAILGIFAVQHIVLVSTLGTTVGHRVFGVQVRRFDGRAPGLGAGILRTLLLCLVVPALISNVDRRGFHDIAAKTVIVRR